MVSWTEFQFFWLGLANLKWKLDEESHLYSLDHNGPTNFYDTFGLDGHEVLQNKTAFPSHRDMMATSQDGNFCEDTGFKIQWFEWL